MRVLKLRLRVGLVQVSYALMLWGGDCYSVSTRCSLGYSEKVPTATGKTNLNADQKSIFASPVHTNLHHFTPFHTFLRHFKPWTKPKSSPENKNKPQSSFSAEGEGGRAAENKSRTHNGWLNGESWIQGLNDKTLIPKPTINCSQEKKLTVPNDLIAEGDNILLYLDVRRTYMIRVEAKGSFHTHKGYIKFEDLIGKPYGSTVKGSLGVNFTILKPQLMDYILKSQRNTQIIYAKDAALIVMFSGIKPGSRVVESGTGTGALTTALAHYVQPTGKIYSYDIRPESPKAAEKNLKRAGLLDLVELKLKDVVIGIDEREVDAVILDMAIPWLVVPQAYEALKPSGTIVSFSPTIDQVVKTVEALREHNFVCIETVECIMRGMQIERGKTRPQTLMTGHTGYITHARKVTKQPSQPPAEPEPAPEQEPENPENND